MPSTKRLPTIEHILAPGGRLAQRLPGYEHRAEQMAVAHTVEEAFQSGRHCLVEAGTGVGKTLAYLIPAIRAAAKGKTTVLSTHTINLQTQLMEKDIPLVAELFAEAEVEVRPVLMKGRGNYLCLQDLDAAESDLFHATDPQFRELKNWVRRTQTGDVADLPFTYPYWHEVAANLDTCRQQECRYYERCFYYRMRWSTQDANLLVVNHALFLSDLRLRISEPQSGILPEYDYVVFDEAHHLEEVATRVFGLEIGNKRIPYFVDRVRRTRNADLNMDRLAALEQMSTAFFAPFQEKGQGGKSDFFFADVLDTPRQQEAADLTTQICVTLEQVQNDLLAKAKDEKDTPVAERLQGLARMGGRLREELHTLLFKTDPDYIRWGESVTPPAAVSRRTKSEPRTTLYFTPIMVGKLLREMLWNRVESVVLASATLANSGGFSYVRGRLGLEEGGNLQVIERVVGSPFDFKQQALLYCPAHLPPPAKSNDRAYVETVADEIERLVKLSGGRAFLLFTSRRMMTEVYDLLAPRLDYPLFQQGEMPSGKLLEAFKQSGNGCLFGTQTFWEGVDVQGDALSLVVIDRLPFAVPDSPVIRARTEAITQAGGDWFTEYSIPQAQIRLKQGFGRLVRTHLDRGIVCILDTRLLTKNYGKEFVRHLPPASRASLWSRVERFWQDTP